MISQCVNHSLRKATKNPMIWKPQAPPHNIMCVQHFFLFQLNLFNFKLNHVKWIMRHCDSIKHKCKWLPIVYQCWWKTILRYGDCEDIQTQPQHNAGRKTGQGNKCKMFCLFLKVNNGWKNIMGFKWNELEREKKLKKHKSSACL